jgi:predicted transcriptional regulator
MSLRAIVQPSGTAGGNAQPRLLPPLELEVMKVLWTEGESSVAEVQTALHDSKPLAYTAVMTLLDRLTRKRAVTRRKQGRGFRYTPAFSREAVLDLAVERLVEDFFDNSRKELAAYLGGQPLSSPVLTPREAQQESIDSVLL